jgi:chemotaxis protein methyltransferase CheR
MGNAAPVNAEDFQRLCDFLYRRTGMVFTEAKRYYVERRVNERMSATGSQSFAAYFARLRIDALGEVEQLPLPSTRPIFIAKSTSFSA